MINKKIAGISVLALLIVMGGYLYIQNSSQLQDNKNSLVPKDSTIDNSLAKTTGIDDVPQSHFSVSKRIFYKTGGVGTKGDLYALDVTTKEKKLISKNISKSLSSRNHQVVAYVDDRNNLLVSSATKNKILLETRPDLFDNDGTPKVNVALVEWSVDDGKFLFYVVANCIPFSSRAEVCPEFYIPPADFMLGYYVANLSTMDVHHVGIDIEGVTPETEENYVFKGWLSDNSAIFKRQKDNKLFEYDFTTNFFTAFDKVAGENTFSFNQFNSGKNNLFVYLEGVANNPAVSSYSAVYFYDGKNSRLIKRGDFAEYQWPRISPDRNFIIFVKYIYGTIGVPWDGLTSSELYLYDVVKNQEQLLLSLGKDTKEGSQMVVSWWDNSHILLEDRTKKVFIIFDVHKKTQVEFSR